MWRFAPAVCSSSVCISRKQLCHVCWFHASSHVVLELSGFVLGGGRMEPRSMLAALICGSGPFWPPVPEVAAGGRRCAVTPSSMLVLSLWYKYGRERALVYFYARHEHVTHFVCLHSALLWIWFAYCVCVCECVCAHAKAARSSVCLYIPALCVLYGTVHEIKNLMLVFQKCEERQNSETWRLI